MLLLWLAKVLQYWLLQKVSVGSLINTILGYKGVFGYLDMGVLQIADKFANIHSVCCICIGIGNWEMLKLHFQKTNIFYSLSFSPAA